MNRRTILENEITKIDEQMIFVERQIQNSDRNITGLIAQKTRHMDKWDLLAAKKTELEDELIALPEDEPEEAGV